MLLDNKLLDDTPCEEIKRVINAMDFMAKRDLLSSLLKKDKRLSRNSNTKLLYEYILERNKYAHGVFCLFAPELKPILQYEENGKMIWALIEKDHIVSFINTYHHLDAWLTALSLNYLN